jgi:phosphotransferase system HPr-like phosphotransfer protein
MTMENTSIVIPAEAGISARPAVTFLPGTPAFAGVTE